MRVKTKHVLAQEKWEFSTVEIFVSGGRYFRAVMNGGYRGAHQPVDQVHGNWSFALEGPTEISQAEALAACAEMGVEEVELPD